MPRSSRTLAQALGFGRTSAAVKSTAPKPPAPKPTASDPTRVRASRVDARKLSADDYERRLAQLGLAPPSEDHRRLTPPLAPEVERAGRRSVDRAERRAEVEQWRADRAREAEVSAGAIDGHTASPDEVRARIASLGFDTTALSVRPVGRPLEPSNAQRAQHDAHEQRERDREVARQVHRAMQVGQRVDARKLTSGELRSLMELRGAGI